MRFPRWTFQREETAMWTHLYTSPSPRIHFWLRKHMLIPSFEPICSGDLVQMSCPPSVCRINGACSGCHIFEHTCTQFDIWTLIFIVQTKCLLDQVLHYILCTILTFQWIVYGVFEVVKPILYCSTSKQIHPHRPSLIQPQPYHWLLTTTTTAKQWI